MGFDLGGLGLDFGAGAAGGGLFGGTPLEGLVPDPAKDMFDKMNAGKAKLDAQARAAANADTLAFDKQQFLQKMSLADQFGIHKLAMLGVPNSGASSPVYTSTGTANFSASPSHAVKADPQENAILGNNVRISAANARQAEAQASLSEMDLAARKQSAVTSTGRPPAARVSNDKAESILKTAEAAGRPYLLANPKVLPEQYNYGETFTALINAGVDPRLALSLSAVDLMQPTSWLTPAITGGQLLKEKAGFGAPYYEQLKGMGYRPDADGVIRVNPRKGGK